MRISQLISTLEKLKVEDGDIDVFIEGRECELRLPQPEVIDPPVHDGVDHLLTIGLRYISL